MWKPLLLSIQIAGSATIVSLIAGVVIAALLSRWRNPIAGALDAFVTLPMVLPPTVLGYFLLVFWGAQSPVGQFLDQIGLPLVFTWRGAALAASVVALPLVVLSSRAAFDAVDPSLRDVARTLGRSDLSIFLSITLPLGWRGVLSGGILAFARALGEFGATLMVASNIPGKTQTLPLAIYDAVQSGNQSEANLLALGLTLTAIILILAFRRLGTTIVGGRAHE
jgi:molybdate transport system permease protein